MGLKECLVECATLCIKSEVILTAHSRFIVPWITKNVTFENAKISILLANDRISNRENVLKGIKDKNSIANF